MNTRARSGRRRIAPLLSKGSLTQNPSFLIQDITEWLLPFAAHLKHLTLQNVELLNAYIWVVQQLRLVSLSECSTASCGGRV